MASTRAELIDTLAATSTQLASLVAGLDDARLDFRPSEDDWTTREILAHLVDDEMYVMRTRLERMVREDLPHLAPHDEQYWYGTRNTNRDGRDDLLADFELQRRASLGIMMMLREEDWQRKGFQPEYGEFTAEGWLQRWVDHDLTHLQQIERNLGSLRVKSAK